MDLLINPNGLTVSTVDVVPAVTSADLESAQVASVPLESSDLHDQMVKVLDCSGDQTRQVEESRSLLYDFEQEAGPSETSIPTISSFRSWFECELGSKYNLAKFNTAWQRIKCVAMLKIIGVSKDTMTRWCQRCGPSKCQAYLTIGEGYFKAAARGNMGIVTLAKARQLAELLANCEDAKEVADWRRTHGLSKSSYESALDGAQKALERIDRMIQTDPGTAAKKYGVQTIKLLVTMKTSFDAICARIPDAHGYVVDNIAKVREVEEVEEVEEVVQTV